MTRHQQINRMVVIGSCALAVSVVDSLIKGNGGGFFGTLSQVGSPWLLLAFLAGAFAGGRRFRSGALAGLGATLLALAGYYFVNSFVVQFGPYSWPADLRLAATSGEKYFALAILSGTTFGVLGVWWRRRLSIVPVVVLGLLFIVEGSVRALHANVFVQYTDQVAALEIIVGVVWIIVARSKTMSLRQRPRVTGTHQSMLQRSST